jgi:ABC-2 type transport system ATP-binding protein
MLLGLVHATAGEVELLGEPMPRHGTRGASAGGSAGRGAGRLGEPVRAREPAAHRRRRPGPRAGRRQRVDDALERVGLGGIDRAPVRAYSLGMRQRLGIAAALLREPEAAAARRADERARPARHRRDTRPC